MKHMDDLEKERYLYFRKTKTPKYDGVEPWIVYFHELYIFDANNVEKVVTISSDVTNLYFLVTALDVALFPELKVGQVWRVIVDDDLDMVSGEIIKNV